MTKVLTPAALRNIKHFSSLYLLLLPFISSKESQHAMLCALNSLLPYIPAQGRGMKLGSQPPRPSARSGRAWWLLPIHILPQEELSLCRSSDAQPRPCAPLHSTSLLASSNSGLGWGKGLAQF